MAISLTLSHQIRTLLSLFFCLFCRKTIAQSVSQFALIGTCVSALESHIVVGSCNSVSCLMLIRLICDVVSNSLTDRVCVRLSPSCAGSLGSERKPARSLWSRYSITVFEWKSQNKKSVIVSIKMISINHHKTTLSLYSLYSLVIPSHLISRDNNSTRWSWRPATTASLTVPTAESASRAHVRPQSPSPLTWLIRKTKILR